MDFFGEIIAVLLEPLAELLLQALLEALLESGLRGLGGMRREGKPPPPIIAGLGYALLGAALGGVSLWLFPHSFIHAAWMRVLNLVLTPVIVGWLMAQIGAWRQRRDQQLIRLDRFAYGFLVAFSMALVRFVWAR